MREGPEQEVKRLHTNLQWLLQHLERAAGDYTQYEHQLERLLQELSTITHPAAGRMLIQIIEYCLERGYVKHRAGSTLPDCPEPVSELLADAITNFHMHMLDREQSVYEAISPSQLAAWRNRLTKLEAGEWYEVYLDELVLDTFPF